MHKSYRNKMIVFTFTKLRIYLERFREISLFIDECDGWTLITAQETVHGAPKDVYASKIQCDDENISFVPYNFW